MEENKSVSILHSKTNVKLFTNDIVEFVDTITNNGTYKKINLKYKAILSSNYSFVEDSITINDNKKDGNITEGILLDDLDTSATFTIKYKVKCLNSSSLEKSYSTLECYYDKDNKFTKINISSNLLYAPILSERLTIIKTSEKPQILVDDTNTFSIKIYNNTDIAFSEIAVVDTLDEKYEFVEGSITIDDVAFEGTNENITIATLPANTSTTIKLNAKGLSNGVTINKASISAKYMLNDTEETISLLSNEVKNNIYSSANDNIVTAYYASPEVSHVSDKLKFFVKVSNETESEITELKIMSDISEHYNVIEDSVKIDETSTTGNINTGIEIGSLNANTTVLVTFDALPINVNNNTSYFVTTTYKYTDNEEALESSKSSNLLYLSTVSSNDQTLPLGLITDKQSYDINEEISYTAYFTNASIKNLNGYFVIASLPEEIELIPNTTYIDDELVSDITSYITVQKQINSYQNSKITFKAIAKNKIDSATSSILLSCHYENEYNTSIASNIQSNNVSVKITDHDKINTNISFELDNGYFCVLDSTANFVINIANKNSYNISIQNLLLKLNLDSKYFTLIEDSIKQDETLVTKNEDGTFTLLDIPSNKTSKITFSATAISKNYDGFKNNAILSFEYKDENNNFVSKTLVANNTMYITQEKEDNVKVEISSNHALANVGDDFGYKIAITNNSEHHISYCMLKDVLPDLIEFKAGSIVINGEEKADLDIKNGILLPEIESGTTMGVEFSVIASKKGTLNNSCYILASYTQTLTSDDSMFGVSSNIASTTIKQEVTASYSITNQVNKNTYDIDDIAIFSIKLKNTGNTDIYNINIVEELNNIFNFIKDSLKIDGYSYSVDTLSNFNVGDLAINEEKVITFEALCEKLGNVTNTILSTAKYSNGSDEIEISSQSEPINIQVLSSSKVTTTLNADNLIKKVNEALTITLKIENNSDKDLNNVIFKESYDPLYYTFANDIKQDDNLVDGNELTGYKLSDISANKTSTVTYTLTAIKAQPEILNKNTINYEWIDENGQIHDSIKSNVIYTNTIDEFNDNFSNILSCDKTDYNVGDEIDFTLTYKNLEDKIVKSLLAKYTPNDGVSYISGSTSLDGDKTTDITDNVKLEDVQSLATHIFTFKCLAKKSGSFSNISFVFETVDDSENTKIYGAQSNELEINIKKLEPNLTIKNSINGTYFNQKAIATLSSTLTNNGQIDFTDANITVPLDSAYIFITNSIKIDGSDYTGDLENINIGSLAINASKVITFQVYCNNIAADIPFSVSGNFKYLDEEKQEQTLAKTSEVVIANIVNDTTIAPTFTLKSDKVLYNINEVATFTFEVNNTNNKNIELYKLLFSNSFLEYFEFDINSLKQDGNIIVNKTNYGYILNNILDLTTSKITFNATAKKVYNTRFNTTVYLDYSYKNEEGNEIHNSTTSSIENFITQDPEDKIIIQKQVDKENCLIDEVLHYTLTITNNLGISIDIGMILDNILEGLEYIKSSTKINGNQTTDITGYNGIILYNIADNAQKEVEFDCTAKAAIQVDNSAYIIANLSEEGIQKTYGKYSNIVSTNVVNEYTPSIEILKSVDTTECEIDEVHTFTLTLKNNGNLTLKNISIKDVLDNALEFVENSIKIDDVAYTGDLSNILIDTLDINKTKIVTFSVICKTEETDVSNTATLSAYYKDKDGQELEISKQSNTISINIYKNITGDFILTSNVSKTNIMVNDVITQTITIENTGNMDLKKIHVMNLLKENFEYITDSFKINNEVYPITSLDDVIVKDLSVSNIETITYDIKAVKAGIDIKNSAIINANYTDKLDEKTVTKMSQNIIEKISDIYVGNYEIKKESSTYACDINDLITISLIVKNTGNTVLEEILIFELLDDALEYQKDSLKINEVVVPSSDLTDPITLTNVAVSEDVLVTFNAIAKSEKTITNAVTSVGKYRNNEGKVVELDINSNEISIDVGKNTTANFSITDIPSTNKCYIGDTISENIVITNTGSYKITDLIFNDYLPENFNFITESFKINNNFVLVTNLENITLPDLDINSKIEVSFNTKAISAGKDLKNASVVKGNYEANILENSLSSPITRTNNSIPLEILDVPIGNYTIEKSTDNLVYELGDTVNITLLLTNTSNTTLNSVAIAESLDNHLLFVNNSITINDVPYTGDLTSDISIGDVEVSNPYIIKFKAIANNISDKVTNQVDVNATYHDKLGSEILVSKKSNEVSIKIIDKISPNINILHSASKSIAKVNDKVTFTTVLTNTGNVDITNLVISDNLSEDFEFVENSIKINDIAYDKQLSENIIIANLEKGDSTTITFEVICKNISSATNQIQVNANYKNKDNIDTLFSKKSNIVDVNISAIDSPNITVIKSSDTSKFEITQTGTFTIEVENTGNTDFTNIQIDEDLDYRFEFIANSILIDGVKYAGDLTSPITIDELKTGVKKVITFTVYANEEGNNIKNKVSLSADYTNQGTKKTLETQSNEISTSIYEPYHTDVEIVQSINENALLLYQEYTVTLTIENNSDVTITDYTLTDELDNNLEFIPDSIKIDSASYSGNLSSILIGTLNRSITKVITFKIRAINIKNNISNIVTGKGKYIDSDFIQKDYSSQSNQILINVIGNGSPKIEFTKEVSSNVANVGDILDFILKFRNTGNVDLEHITLADNLDELFDYVPGSTKIDNVKIESENILTGLHFDKLLVNEYHRIDFKVIAANAHKGIKNSAVLSAYYGKEILNPHTNEVEIDVLNDKTFNVEFTNSTPKQTYYLNEIIKFKLNLSNTSNMYIEKAVVTDDITDYFEIIPNTTYIDDVKTNGNIIDGISLNGIPEGNSKTISFDAYAKQKASNIQNSAKAKIIYNDGEQKTNEKSSNTLTLNILEPFIADIEIEKSAGLTSLFVDEKTTVTLRITNSGEAVLSKIKVFDILPHGLKFVQNSLKIDYVSVEGNITEGITIPDMQKNHVTFVTFDVIATKVINLKNKAHIVCSYTDLESVEKILEKDSNELYMDISEEKKLSILLNKTSNKQSYYKDEIATFTLFIQNSGNIDINNIIVTDSLPSNYLFVPNSVTVNGIEKENVDITKGINLSPLLSDEEAIIKFKATAKQVQNDIENYFNISFDYIDETSQIKHKTINSNNCITNIFDSQDVIINLSKNQNIDNVNVGDVITYTLTLENISSLKASNLTVIDTLDKSFKFIENSLKIDGNTTDFDIQKGIKIQELLPSNTSKITFKVTAILPGIDIKNTSKVSYSYLNLETLVSKEVVSNETLTTINDIPVATLNISKSAEFYNTLKDEKNIFTITVTNTSDYPASNVLIQDIVDLSYEIINTSLKLDNVSTSGNLITGILIDNINAHETKTLSFEVIGKTIKNNISNIALLSYESAGISKTIYSNDAITNITAYDFPFFIFTKESSKKSLLVNEINNITISITNVQSTSAYNVLLKDVIDNAYEIVENTLKVNGNQVSGDITKGINIGIIDLDETKKVTFDIKAITPKENISNIASINYSYLNYKNIEINDTIPSSEDITSIITANEAKLKITKKLSKDVIYLNEENTVLLNIVNIGNAVASQIAVSDILPENYSLVNDYVLYDNQILTGDILTGIEIHDLMPNESATISFEVKGIKQGNNILNTAKCEYKDNTTLKEEFSNSVSSTISDYPLAKLDVVKSVSNKINNINDEIKYSIKITNNGNATAECLVVSDPLANELKFIEGSIYINNQNSISQTNNSIDLGDLMPTESITVEFKAKAIMKGTKIGNHANISCKYLKSPNIYEALSSSTNNVYIDIVIPPTVDLWIDQEVKSEIVKIFDTNKFTFKFKNSGETILNNVKLYNYLPNNYDIIKDSIIISSNNIQSRDAITLELNSNLDPIEIGTLIPNEEKTLSFSAIAIMNDANILNRANATYEYVNEQGITNLAGVNSYSTFTDIIEDDTALISIDKTTSNISSLNTEQTVKIVLKNIGNTTAKNITLNEKIDDAFDFVQDSITINDVKKDIDILDRILLNDMNANDTITITYKINTRSIKSNAITTSNLSYEYTDINQILIRKDYTKTTTTNILEDIADDITIIKDSIYSNYLIEDLIPYRIIVTNTSQIDITNNVIMDTLPDSFQFVANSLKINNEYVEGNIEDGIKIDTISKNTFKVITFYVKPTSSKTNIGNVAKIDYEYMINDKEINETLNSNTLFINVYDNYEPTILFKKESSKKVIALNEIVTFTLTLKNTGILPIENISIYDTLDSHYRFIYNSIKVDNVTTNYSLDDILLPEILPNKSVTITFNAMAIQIGKDIENTAKIEYEYLDIRSQLIDVLDSSNTISTNIIPETNKVIINLLDSVANEESVIADIIEKETEKLNTVLHITSDKQKIILINNSITNMIDVLITKEQTSIDKLNSIIQIFK